MLAAMARGTDTQPPEGFRIRPLEAGELPHYLDHLLRLDQRALWLRFDHAMDTAAIQTHCLGLMRPDARILGAFVEGVMRGAAELSPWRDGGRDCTELAFSVEPEFQRCGLGSRLIAHALDIVRPGPAVMLCRAANKGMIALARRAGADIVPQGNHLLCIVDTAAPAWPERQRLLRTSADPGLLALTRGYV